MIVSNKIFIFGALSLAFTCSQAASDISDAICSQVFYSESSLDPSKVPPAFRTDLTADLPQLAQLNQQIVDTLMKLSFKPYARHIAESKVPIDTANIREASKGYLLNWGTGDRHPSEILRVLDAKDYSGVYSSGLRDYEIYTAQSVEYWLAGYKTLAQVSSDELVFNRPLIEKAYQLVVPQVSKKPQWLQSLRRWLGISNLDQEKNQTVPWRVPQDAQPLIKEFSNLDQASVVRLRSVTDELIKLGVFTNEEFSCIGCELFKLNIKETTEQNLSSGNLEYGAAHLVSKRMNRLLQWTSEQMRLIDNKSVAALDPIDLASAFYYTFDALSPLREGSKRVARALRDRILLKYGIAPSTPLYRLGDELALGLKTNQMLTRLGVKNFLTLQSKIPQTTYTHPAAIGQHALAIDLNLLRAPSADSKTYSQLTEAQLNQVTKKYSQPRVYGKGSNSVRLQLTLSGFFVDNFGVTYLLDVRSRTIFPVVEKSLTIYTNPAYNRADQPGFYKLAGPEHNKLAFETAEFLSRASESDLQNLKIKPFETVSIARKTGELFFQPEQLEAVESYLTGQLAKDFKGLPFLAGGLSRPKLAETFVGQNMELRGNVRFPQLVAEYELRDFYLWELQQYFEASKDAKIVQLITAVRKKLHREARNLLDPYLRVVSEAFDLTYDRASDLFFGKEVRLLSIPLKSALRKEPSVRVSAAQLKYSKLRFSDYESALQKLGDDTVVVGRVAAPGSEKAGLLPVGRMVNFLDHLPKVKAFIKQLYLRTQGDSEISDLAPDHKLASFAAKILTEKKLSESPAYKSLMGVLKDQVLVSPNDYFGFERSLRGFYSDYRLHVGGVHPGLYVSMSLDTFVLSKLNKEENNFYFSKFTEGRKNSSVLMMVRLQKRKLKRFSNQYQSEYELSLDEPVLPHHLKRSLVEFVKSEDAVEAQKNPIKSYNAHEDLVLAVVESDMDLIKATLK